MNSFVIRYVNVKKFLNKFIIHKKRAYISALKHLVLIAPLMFKKHVEPMTFVVRLIKKLANRSFFTSNVNLLYKFSQKVLYLLPYRYNIYSFIKLFIKSLMAIIIFIILMPVMLVEAGNVPNQTPNEVFSDLINTFSQEEIDNFNRRVQEIINHDLSVQHNAIFDFYRRIAFAIIINASIYVIFRYGSDIINSVWDFFRSLPDTATNAVQFLFTTARDVAIQNYQRATPEQQNAMLAVARDIAHMRNQVPPAV